MTNEQQSQKMSFRQAVTSQGNRITIVFALCTLLIVFLFLALKFATSDNLLYQLFSDRDLWRASDAHNTFPFMGPEHSGAGHRIPGGFFYYFLWFWQQISPQVGFINDVVILMFAASVVLLMIMANRYSGPVAAVTAAGVYASIGFWFDVLFLWNPGFLPLFVVAIYFFYLRIVVDGNRGSFLWLMLLVSLTMQFHSQATILLVLALAGIAVTRPRIGWRYIGLGCVLFLLPLAHYVYAEATTGWINTVMMKSPTGGPSASHMQPFSAEFFVNLISVAQGCIERLFADSGVVFAPAFMGKYPIIGMSLHGADYAILALIAVGAMTWVARPVSATCRTFWHGEKIYGHMICAVAIYCLIYALSHRGFYAKHVIAAVPAAVIIVGVSAARIFDWLMLKRRLPVGSVVAVAIMALLGTRFTAPVILLATQSPESTNDINSDIAGHLKRSLYSDREVFENSTFAWGNITTRDVQEDYGRISYFHRQAISREQQSNSEICTIVVDKRAPAARAPDGLSDMVLGHPRIRRLRPQPLSPSESLTAYYIHYRTPSGNCLKSYVNSYLPSRLERQLQTDLDALPSSAGSVLRKDAGATRWFIFRPSTNRPSVVVGISQRQGEFVAVLDGTGLRGPSGLSGMAGPIRIDRPQLTFSKRGQEPGSTVTVFDGILGDFEDGTLAPWQSMPFRLPEGEMVVRFKGREVDRHGRPVGEPFDILLTDQFEAKR